MRARLLGTLCEKTRELIGSGVSQTKKSSDVSGDLRTRRAEAGSRAGLGEMAITLEQWYRQMPVVTRSYLTLSFLTTAGCALELHLALLGLL